MVAETAGAVEWQSGTCEGLGRYWWFRARNVEGEHRTVEVRRHQGGEWSLLLWGTAGIIQRKPLGRSVLGAAKQAALEWAAEHGVVPAEVGE